MLLNNDFPTFLHSYYKYIYIYINAYNFYSLIYSFYISIFNGKSSRIVGENSETCMDAEVEASYMVEKCVKMM